MFIIININLELLYKYTIYIYIVGLILLVLVLIPGIGVVRGGARSWIGIGSFSIQPSEFMKLASIMMLSKYLSKNYKKITSFFELLKLLIVICFTFFLIMLQPDFGTGLVLVLSCVLLLFNAGAKYKYFIILGIVGVLAFVVLIISAPYRLTRIFAFLDPWQDPLGSGFQSIQSLYAIAPSGIFGLGFNNSVQKHFFLPEPQNDFIFAIICEEFGLIGGILIIICFLYIIITGIKTSIYVDDLYLKFLSIGISLMFYVQVFINIGVVIGLLPVTGITLPILSYGGSSLVLTLISLGVLINITKYTERG
jgi:cell division protein FtsW